MKSFDGNTYTYNANGIRTSKTVDGVKHIYTLDGMKILRETWNGNTLTPLYDNEDSVCGIVYNDEPFYFQKNLQGDVVGIVDKDANVVAAYAYDAWGVCTVTQDTSGAGIANLNPYRYRGYYYDAEIGLYYVSSRYYDPEVGRLLNADMAEILGFSVISNSVFGVNLFIYCLNNPTNDHDMFGSISANQIANMFSISTIFALFMLTLCASYSKGLVAVGAYAAKIVTPVAVKAFWWKPWLAAAIILATVAIIVAAVAIYANKQINAKIHNIVVKVSKKHKGKKGNDGKSNPNNLKRGMSKNQAEKFQRAIEDYKKYSGMPPDYNLPWEVLVALAEEIKNQFK